MDIVTVMTVIFGMAAAICACITFASIWGTK
jgi:hypothetical protein